MNPNAPIPVIRLEVEHMKHSMMLHLGQYTAQMDAMLQEAVERFCSPQNLAQIIQQETNRVLNQVIKEEVSRWFTHGEGREAIKAAVAERLRTNTSDTPVDEDWKTP